MGSRTNKSTTNQLLRIHDFLEKKPVSIAVGDLKRPMTELDSVLGELKEHERNGETRRRAGIAATGKARTLAQGAEDDFLIPLARAARHVFPEGSNLRTAMKYRRSARRPTTVLKTLRSMAEAAAPYSAELAAAGFADDFAKRMNAAADALEAAILAREQDVGTRAAATLGKRLTAQRVRTLLPLLDALVAPRLAGTALFAEWKSLLKQGRVRPGASDPEEETIPGDDTASATTPPAPQPAAGVTRKAA